MGQTQAQRSSALSRCGVNAVAKELGQLSPQPLVPWIFVQVCVPELVDGTAVHRQRQCAGGQGKGACHALGKALRHCGDQVRVAQHIAQGHMCGTVSRMRR